MDLARIENGGRLLTASCSDDRYPKENMLDGSENTGWVTTGMFPHEFLLDLGTLSSITQIGTICKNGEEDSSGKESMMI